MYIHHRHAWNLTPQQAVDLQKKLAAEIQADRPVDLSQVQFVGGVDVSVKNNISQAAVIVVTYPGLELVETVTATQPTPFPYIPGLLTFREGPVLEEAFGLLQHEPDIFIFDGMGIIHPRRMGIAAHMGLWLEKPTVGCGKSYFIGQYVEPGMNKGDYSDLHHKGEIIGAVLRTRANVKPVFISAGHLADLPTALQLTMTCTTKYRLPDPIRMAHNAAGTL